LITEHVVTSLRREANGVVTRLGGICQGGDLWDVVIDFSQVGDASGIQMTFC
jgi:hypothetical protein